MRYKSIIKIVSILILMILFINNIGYAVNFTQENFKDSLTRMFKSNIIIELEVKSKIQPGEGVTIEGDQYVTSTSKTTYTPEENIEVTDSQIIYTEGENGEEKSLKVDYEIKDNKLIFDMNTNLEELGIDLEEDQMKILVASFLYKQITLLGYLAAADTLGIDLNLAEAYQTQLQNENQDSQVINTELITETLNIEEVPIITGHTEINLEKLKEIKDSDLDGTVIAKVTVTYLPTDDETNEDLENNDINNEIDNSNTNIVNNETDNSKENTIIKDDTISDNKIPAAGANIIEYALILLAIISLVAYFKSKQFDDIK